MRLRPRSASCYCLPRSDWQYRFHTNLEELLMHVNFARRHLLMMSAVTAAGLAACGDLATDPATDTAGAGAAATEDELIANAANEAIHFIGRFDMSVPSAPVFEWSGSAIWTRFAGPSISVELDGSANDFEVEIDGVRQPVIFHPGGDQVYQLASGLGRGEHDLKLTRRTEAFFSTSVFRGFRGARLVPTRRPARLIEMIGDSITCGYGVAGPPGCSFSHDTEAETDAYGARTARQLGAAHHAICWSGIGAFRNFGDLAQPRMPERYQWIEPLESAAPWGFTTRPQAVVINLGTNDFSGGVDPGQGYVQAMTAFVAQVRGHHPAAPIVLATSPMLDGAQHATEKAYLEAVARTDRRTTVLDMAVQQASDGFGCDFHPSEITAQKMADQLEAELRHLLHW
jgi:lysophospholipase L1-like esterase